MKLEGKVALITGGARGLGKAFAEVILDDGGQVCLLDLLIDSGLDTADEFNDTYGSGSALFIKCDVTSDADLKRNVNDIIYAFQTTKDTFGRLDLVINNAGIAGEAIDIFQPKWKKIIDVDLTAVVRGTILAHEFMSTDNGGNGGLLINIASTAGLTAVPTEPVYAAAKHGVVGLSRSVAPVFEGVGIRVACICPSFTKTEMVMSRLGGEENIPEQMSSLGLMEISDVVKGFRDVVDRDDVTGTVLAVTPKGLNYKFPRTLKSKM